MLHLMFAFLNNSLTYMGKLDCASLLKTCRDMAWDTALDNRIELGLLFKSSWRRLQAAPLVGFGAGN